MHSFSDIAATGWPEDWSQDWYVCDGAGGVDGPLPAIEIFSRPNHESDRRPGAEGARRFVSRRGFAQWYDAEDFVGLFCAATKLSAVATQAMEVAHDQVSGKWEIEPSEAIEIMKFEDREVFSVDDDILNALVMTGVNPSVLASPVAVSELMPETATEISPRIESSISKDHQHRTGRPPIEPRLAWLSQRAKARLGDLRNPVVPAFLTMITCGVYYTGWLLGAMREVVWHLDHDTIVKRHIAKPWMAWIPGLHIKATWDLACLIRTMEEQDGYTSTRPTTAAFLSIIPPLASVYLQHSLNDHWLIHCLDPQGLGDGAPEISGYFPMQNELKTTSSTSSA